MYDIDHLPDFGLHYFIIYVCLCHLYSSSHENSVHGDQCIDTNFVHCIRSPRFKRIFHAMASTSTEKNLTLSEIRRQNNAIKMTSEIQKIVLIGNTRSWIIYNVAPLLFCKVSRGRPEDPEPVANKDVRKRSLW